MLDAKAGERRFVLAGHSMGAHTAVAYALEHPERVAGLVLIGPVYGGSSARRRCEYWDGLAAALEEGGVEGFVGLHRRRPASTPAWRETVLRITRERISLHRHPEALAEALRQVPRSRPFETMDELEFLDVPTLVVASHDVADPGHPYAVAEAYAERDPRRHADQRGGGRVAAGLAGRQALARDRRILRGGGGRRAPRQPGRQSRAQ